MEANAQLRRIVASILFAVATSGAGLAQTFIVDANGAGDFTDLATAVASAPDGAVLRVRPGIYYEFVLMNKSLSILGDSSRTVSVYCRGGNIVIASTNPTQRIHLAGMTWVPMPDYLPRDVYFTDLQGSVYVEDVAIGSTYAVPDAMTLVSRCRNLHFERCTMTGKLPMAPGAPGAQRLAATDSTIQLARCEVLGPPAMFMALAPPAMRCTASTIVCVSCKITGGDGALAWSVPALDGGDGGTAMLLANGSVLHAYGDGTSIVGGAGGAVLRPTTGRGGNGGTGLVLEASTAQLVGVMPSGGLGGSGTTGNGTAGVGVIADPASSVRSLAAAGPSFAVSAGIAPNAPATLTLRANAGDIATIVVGTPALFASAPQVPSLGALFCVPLLAYGPFRVPASGVLRLPVHIPASWPRDRLVLAQCLVLPSSVPELWASNSVSLLIES